MATVYKCVNTCTWDGRYWEEGDLTHPLHANKKPPKHFEPADKAEDIKYVLDEIDQEDEPQTFAELSQQLLDIGNTGTGIMAGDLHLKNYKQLQKMAKDKGLPIDGINTKDELITLLEKEEGE